MKINNINLISYGKFENKEVSFSDGLNIVKGSNEAGKSTILSFIKAMIFGYSGRGSVTANDRKHYMPWNKNILSGTMDATLDNGKTVKISRTSGKSQGFDKLECFDTSNGEGYEFIAENEIGCSEDAFLKTLCIKQLQTPISGEDDEISKKLINLIGSGNEDVNAKESEEAISDYMKKFKALRGEKGLIFELQNKINEISERIAEAENQRILAFEKIKEKKQLADKIKQCKDKLTFIQKSRESVKNNDLFERLDSLVKSKSGIESEISSLKNEILQLSDIASSLSAYQNEPPEAIFTPLCETASLESEIEKQEKSLKRFKTLSLIFSSLVIIAGIFSIFYLPVIFSEVILLPLLIFFITKVAKQKASLTSSCEELSKTAAQNEEITAALKQYGAADIKEYAEKKAKYTSVISEIEIITSSLEASEKKLSETQAEIKIYEEKTKGLERGNFKYTAEELSEEENEINIILEDAISRSSHIDGFLSAAESEEETPDVLTAKREQLISALNKANTEFEAASLALSAVSEVFAQMRSDFTPLVNSRASEYLTELTEGSIDKIYIDKKFSVTAESGGIYDLSYFSLGTADQTYLAIRLAIIDLLFENNKPIFIDDAFLQYDKKREYAAFRLLLKKAEEGRQIIFFTCKDIPPFLESANIIDLDNLN